MNTPAAASVSLPFLPMPTGPSDSSAPSETKTSLPKPDTNDPAGFLALLTLLFPGMLPAPVSQSAPGATPTVPTAAAKTPPPASPLASSEPPPGLIGNSGENTSASAATKQLGSACASALETNTEPAKQMPVSVTSNATAAVATADVPPPLPAQPALAQQVPLEPTANLSRGGADPSKPSMISGTTPPGRSADLEPPGPGRTVDAPTMALPQVDSLNARFGSLATLDDPSTNDVGNTSEPNGVKHTGNESDKTSAPISPGANDSSRPPIARNDGAKPATLVEQVHDTFRGHLDQLQQQGRVEVQMDLHPPELGRMQLHLSMEDNHLNVRMVVQDDNAKRMLEQQIEPLRVRFAEMGVNLGQLDVRRDSGAPGQQPPPDSERPSASAQTGQAATNRLRNSYGQSASSTALVDVIA